MFESTIYRFIYIFRKGGTAVDAAAAATMVLEDAGETNAGKATSRRRVT